jgi:hypothetical protein
MAEAPWYEIPKVPVPKTLYKYCPPERIDILERLQVRFSPPSEFNDTFDSYQLIPALSGMEAKRERLRLRRCLGILCLTARSDSHLMWANYAKNHTGFVIGFDAHAPFFEEGDRVLRKVQYRRKPKVLPVPDKCGCFYKSSQWIYEREWRCVREFDPSEPRMVPIDPTLITRIVIGHRMEAWHIAQLALCVEVNAMTSVEFFLSSPSPTSWEFLRKPKSVLQCEKCGGQGYLIKDRE